MSMPYDPADADPDGRHVHDDCEKQMREMDKEIARIDLENSRLRGLLGRWLVTFENIAGPALIKSTRETLEGSK